LDIYLVTFGRFNLNIGQSSLPSLAPEISERWKGGSGGVLKSAMGYECSEMENTQSFGKAF